METILYINPVRNTEHPYLNHDLDKYPTLNIIGFEYSIKGPNGVFTPLETPYISPLEVLTTEKPVEANGEIRQSSERVLNPHTDTKYLYSCILYEVIEKIKAAGEESTEEKPLLKICTEEIMYTIFDGLEQLDGVVTIEAIKKAGITPEEFDGRTRQYGHDQVVRKVSKALTESVPGPN
ncbi:hypothetical protein ACFL0W_03465 [Nanoarchaeota archaeon]